MKVIEGIHDVEDVKDSYDPRALKLGVRADNIVTKQGLEAGVLSWDDVVGYRLYATELVLGAADRAGDEKVVAEMEKLRQVHLDSDRSHETSRLN
jgi:hypothetical protein